MLVASFPVDIVAALWQNNQMRTNLAWVVLQHSHWHKGLEKGEFVELLEYELAVAAAFVSEVAACACATMHKHQVQCLNL